MNSNVIEVQCDGLIGPTHNYSGLSFGNIASSNNAENTSYPKMAALQGLNKMKFVHDLGCAQIILPPPLRPNEALLDMAQVSDTNNLSAIQKQIWRAAWSASTMWSANAATVSPAADCADNILHITIANLLSGMHRAQEAPERYEQFKQIFGKVARIHPALFACAPLSDEGAANHMRLCKSHGESGVEIFVYGRNEQSAPKKFPARQTQKSCDLLALHHALPESRTVIAQQHPTAIDAGVFHNDVIAMSNQNTLILHEYTFAEHAATLNEIQNKCDFDLCVITIKESELSLSDAVKSYFYNSQLLTLTDGSMAIIAPTEVRDTPDAAAQMQRLVDDAHCPVQAVHYLDVRESMKNGGGPACLRLRVAIEQNALEHIPSAYRFSDQQYDTLSKLIERYYPNEIAPDDIYSTTLKNDVITAYKMLMTAFGSN